MLNLPASTTKFEVIGLAGGLDLATPQLKVKPGVAREALNFECAMTGGYSRIAGYERFDGRPSPSDAVAMPLAVSGLGALAVGDAVTGATSGASGVVCALEPGLVVLTKLVGVFTEGESLRRAGVHQATVLLVGASASDAMAELRQLAAAAGSYRADIQPVPGSGPIRGLAVYRGAVYAWRDNASATALAIYRSSPTGWQLVPLLREVAFTGGSGNPPAEGATITRGGVSAVVRRVVTESGDWVAGTAAGRFVIAAPTGGSFTAGALSAGATATLAGPDSQITLLPGGRVRVDVGNVGNGVRVYGVDGQNPAFEFDGTVLVKIKSGMTDDRPSHVAVHKNHLFLAFDSNVQHSGIGQPYRFTVLAGGLALAVNETVTGFLRLPGDSQTAALAIFTDGTSSVLYGRNAQDWNLVEFSNGAGSKPDTQQVIGQAFVLDERGVMSLAASQEFGNFASAALTVNLRPFLSSRRNSATASMVNREKSQYRVFFADGQGLWLTIVNNRFIGAMPVQFRHVVRCAATGEGADGSERSFVGSDDGLVFELERGTSFDGQSIPASFALSFAAQGSSRVRKRYRRASFEVQGDGYNEFSAGWELGYGSVDVEQPGISAATQATYWDAFTWDSFTWDGRAIAPSEVSLEGTAENISIRVEQDSELFRPWTMNSVTLHFTPRRAMR